MLLTSSGLAQEGVLLPSSATAAHQRPTPGSALAQAAIIAPDATDSLGLATAQAPALQKPSKRRREGEDSGHDTAVKENGLLPNGVHEEEHAEGMETDDDDGRPTLGEQLAAMGIVPRDEVSSCPCDAACCWAGVWLQPDCLLMWSGPDGPLAACVAPFCYMLSTADGVLERHLLMQRH